MRITGGEACGRPIAVPSIHGVRPTGSKMRQSLFNILGKKVRDAVVLDLFAGSGLMGFETISRGAASLTCVEKNMFCMRCIEINTEKLGYQKKIKMIRDDFRRAIASLSGQQFDIIFADPPYKSDYAQLVLSMVEENKLLKKEGILIIEHTKSTVLDLQTKELSLIESRPYSLSALSFFTTTKI